MFADQELCDEFWKFVRFRAFDPEDDYAFSPALMHLDWNRRRLAVWLQPGDTRIEPPGAFNEEDADVPVVYPTVQQAFIDFLIDRIGNNWVPDFLDWLRAQALIMAQAAREPEWLTVKTPVVHEHGRWSPRELTTHTMIIAAGSWDALSQETFDVLVRRFYAPKPSDTPLRNSYAKRLMRQLGEE